MNTLSPSPAVEQQVRCWCGNAQLEGFSPEYWRCADCETLVLREMRGEEISRITDDERDFYGKGYYQHHVQKDYGLPDLETRARADLPERCLHWLRTLLKFVPGPGARTLELGCGHGGFVAMQRWAGLDATGLELSPWLVGRAREWFGVPVLEGRLEDQDLPAASHDAVVLMDVLEHLPDPRRTISRAVSLLRSPGGFLLIQTPCYPAGMSYETLLARDHPFLVQLKPMEHLYLFSERALARLCAEVGLGQVRFEPAIFAHYDQFAVASAGPLRERSTAERAQLLMAASPPARWTLALFDLAETRDAASARLGDAESARNLLAAQLADLQRHFDGVAADGKARLEVIERQGAEIAKLHAEIDQWLREAAEFWPKLDVAVNARNLLTAQMEDLRGHFEGSEADRAARLEVIHNQGAEIGRLRAEAEHWRQTAGDLQPKLEQAWRERDLSSAQLAETRADLESHAEEGVAHRETIGDHEATIAGLRARLAGAENDLTTLRERERTLDAHWTARLLKGLRLWPR